MTTTGEALTATLRSSFRINSRSRDHRDGGSLKADMLESIENAVWYPGYYSPERTALSQAAFGAVLAYRKHVDGFRVDGMVRYQIMRMSPWQFAGLIGEMVDAGVENTGAGEVFFGRMSRSAA